MFQNPNLIHKHLRSQQNCTQSKLTPGKASLLSTITVASPSSPSTPQTTLSTPPSTTHILIVIPTPPVVTSISATMENRYTPLHLPTNPGAMPPDYQIKITSFEGTDTYTTQQHAKKMTEYFEIYEVDVDDVIMKLFVKSLTGDFIT